jgi:hypothetical protein
MSTTPVFVRRRARLRAAESHPVELRFTDMLMIVIATLMLVSITMSVVSAFTGSGRPDVAPAVTTRSAPAAIAGQPYSLTLAVQGGDGDYTWRPAAGELPAGLSLSPAGVVEGTPERAEATRLSVRVTDGSGRASEPRELSFRVRPDGQGAVEQAPLHIVSAVTLLDDAVEGEDYRHVFRADADTGAPPYRWRGSELPDGLQLAPDGTLAGRPEAGASTFTVTMTDAGGATVRQEVRMDVAEAPESLFWRLLGWLRTAITLYGYFLVAAGFVIWIIGHPGSTRRPPIWERWGNRRSA